MKKYLLALLTTLSLNAVATDKIIEIVVPYGPGGAASNYAQLVSEILTDNGRPAVVVNKPGADAVIGANYAAKAKADGKTLFLGTTSSIAANVVFNAPGMEYNKDTFDPVIMLNQLSLTLAVPASSPIKNYEQFKFYVRANPEKFNLGFYNTNIANIFFDWAEKENLPRPTIIMYKGSAQLDTDLAGGNLPFAFDNYAPPMTPLIEAGKIRVIASLDNTVPGVPNLSKHHPELAFGVWYGLFANTGTPKSVITEINQLINTEIKKPKYANKIKEMNIRYIGGTPKDLQALQIRDLNTLKRFFKESN